MALDLLLGPRKRNWSRGSLVAVPPVPPAPETPGERLVARAKEIDSSIKARPIGSRGFMISKRVRWG